MSSGQNGKGDSPRNNFSDEFREGYDAINWGKGNKEVSLTPETKRYFDELMELSRCRIYNNLDIESEEYSERMKYYDTKN